MQKYSSPSFDLQTQDGQPVYGDLRGNYSLGGGAYDKYGAPHGRINLTKRQDATGQRRAKILAEAQTQLGVALRWANGETVCGLAV